MIRKVLIAASFASLTGAAVAHDAPVHAHTQLVPIPPYSQTYGEASAAAALDAVTKFLAAFDGETKATLMFDLEAQERTGWSNLPAGIVERSGISVGDMSDEQRALLFELLSASLNVEGYESVEEVMAAEAFLSGDARAERLQWAPENYWFSLYGMPSETGQWGWQFGGHHLALNIAIGDNVVSSMSPSFVGTEPAVFTYAGKDYTAVRDMHLAGHAVFAALDDAQKARADAGDIPEDVLTGPGQLGTIPPVIGISAADMTPEQRVLLLKAIAEWVTIQPSENAAPRMAEIESQLDQISYAWTGGTDVNTPVYMRIQGPTLIIEMLATGGNVGDSAQGAGHYHTIYRNPENEYGLGAN